MFSQDDLDRLIDAMRANQVAALTVEDGGETLHLKLAPVAADSTPAPMPTPAPLDLTPAKSPAIGRFVARGADDGLAALEAASQIGQGDILGYIAHGHIRLPVTAPATGVLASATPDSDTIFGYGDVVFELEVSP